MMKKIILISVLLVGVYSCSVDESVYDTYEFNNEYFLERSSHFEKSLIDQSNYVKNDTLNLFDGDDDPRLNPKGDNTQKGYPGGIEYTSY